MAIGTPHGFGRTRRPKELINDSVVETKMPPTSVTCVAAAALNDDLNDSNSGENGYKTENQRFLHLQIENDGTDDTLTVYGYNYAFGSWAILYIPVGVKNGSDTTANLAYVEAKFTTINGKFMLTIPIEGVDRVGFVHDGSLNDMVVRAACSSF